MLRTFAPVRRSSFAAALTLSLGAALVAPVVSPLPVASSVASAARATTGDQQCRGMNKLIRTAPKTHALPGGAQMAVWDDKRKPRLTAKAKKRIKNAPTKAKKQRIRKKAQARAKIRAKRHLRITALTIPESSTLRGRAYARGPVNGVRKTGFHTRPDPGVVFATNGSVFELGGGRPPRGPLIVDGDVRNINRSWEGAVVTLASGRTDFAQVAVRGTVTAGGTRYQVRGVNEDRLDPAGVTVYTRDWGPVSKARRPSSDVDLVVGIDDGIVRSVRTGAALGKRPPLGTYIVAASGVAGGDLRLLRVGDEVDVDFWAVARTLDAPRVRISDADPVVAAVGYSARLMSDGVIKAGQCTARNELKRPRTVYGKRANGDLVVMTVSGRHGKNAEHVGGASMQQALRYMRHIGVREAVILDGGGSTTLMLRRKASGPLLRRDRGKKVGKQRRVGNAFGFTLSSA